MDIFLLSSLAASYICVFLGIDILYRTQEQSWVQSLPKSENYSFRLLAAYLILSGIYSLAEFQLATANNQQVIQFWAFLLGFWPIIPTVLLLFVVLFCNFGKRYWYFLFILVPTVVVLIILSISFFKLPGVLKFNSYYYIDSPFLYQFPYKILPFFSICMHVLSILILIVFIVKNRGSKRNAAIFLVLSMSAADVILVVFQNLSINRYQTLYGFSYLLFALAIFVAAHSRTFLNIIPELSSNLIVNVIHDPIIITDENEVVTAINKAAELIWEDFNLNDDIQVTALFTKFDRNIRS